MTNSKLYDYDKFYRLLTDKIKLIDDGKWNLHISESNINKINKIIQKPFYKPNGLWISGLYKSSNNYYWTNFIIKEEYLNKIDLYKNKYYIIKLNKDKIYKIDNIKKFKEFVKKYKSNIKLEDIKMFNKTLKNYYIDWNRVQEDGYKGISIVPYNKEYMKNNVWYRWWDVSSSCIWDPDGIKEIKKINVSDLLQKNKLKT
jgi:hypothetical protein